MMSFFMDCTVGVLINYILLKIVEFIFVRKLKFTSLKSGNYGDSADIRQLSLKSYFIQLTVWMLIMVVVSVLFFVLFFFFLLKKKKFPPKKHKNMQTKIFTCVLMFAGVKPIEFVGYYMLYFVNNYPNIKLLIVMLIVPFLLNVFQFWVSDQFIKKRKSAAAAAAASAGAASASSSPVKVVGKSKGENDRTRDEEEDDDDDVEARDRADSMISMASPIAITIEDDEQTLLTPSGGSLTRESGEAATTMQQHHHHHHHHNHQNNDSAFVGEDILESGDYVHSLGKRSSSRSSHGHHPHHHHQNNDNNTNNSVGGGIAGGDGQFYREIDEEDEENEGGFHGERESETTRLVDRGGRNISRNQTNNSNNQSYSTETPPNN